MSSTGRGDGERMEADHYPTPSWCVRRLLEQVPLPGGRWLEPAAGDGAIIKAVNKVRTDVEWTAVDIHSVPLFTHPAKEFHCDDFTQWIKHRTLNERWKVVLTNPPYSLAQQFIDACLDWADYVVMLLRLNYLGSEKRAEFMRSHPPDVYVLPNRPSFVAPAGRRKGSNDSCEYGWFVWTHHDETFGRVQVLPTTSRLERAAR